MKKENLNILKKIINYSSGVISRIKEDDQKARQEYFQRTFFTPPKPGEPEIRKRGEDTYNGVVFYDEKWNQATGQWEEIDRYYYSSGGR